MNQILFEDYFEWSNLKNKYMAYFFYKDLSELHKTVYTENIFLSQWDDWILIYIHTYIAQRAKDTP